MEVLYLLIPLSVLLVLSVIALLWWACMNGQFDDLERMGEDLLFDDDRTADPGPDATSLPVIELNQGRHQE